MRCPKCNNENGTITVEYIGVSRSLKLSLENGEHIDGEYETTSDGIAIRATCEDCEYTGPPEEFGLGETPPEEYIGELNLKVFLTNEIWEETDMDICEELEERGLECSNSGVGFGIHNWTFETDECDREALNLYMSAEKYLVDLLTEKYGEPDPDITKAKWNVDLTAEVSTGL